jgi:hypothetical protein
VVFTWNALGILLSIDLAEFMETPSKVGKKASIGILEAVNVPGMEMPSCKVELRTCEQ